MNNNNKVIDLSVLARATLPANYFNLRLPANLFRDTVPFSITRAMDRFVVFQFNFSSEPLWSFLEIQASPPEFMLRKSDLRLDPYICIFLKVS